MNADLLVPGSSVFYLRGTTGKRVPATVVGLGIISRMKFLTSLKWNRTQILRRVPQALVMTQVMRMAPHALTVLARTTHRCPYISPFSV